MDLPLIRVGGDDEGNCCPVEDCPEVAHNYTVGGYRDYPGYFTACRAHAQDEAQTFVDDAIRYLAAQGDYR